MKKIFIDSDIILDVLSQREPHYLSAAPLFALVETGEIRAFTSPLVFSNLSYILRRAEPRQDSMNHLRKIRLLLHVYPIDEKIIDLALSSDFEDFEDAIQYYTAVENNSDCFVTRNKKDFRKSKIPVHTAEEYLKIHK